MRSSWLDRCRVLGVQVVLPALLFSAASAWVFDRDAVIRWLAAHRPSAAQSTLEVNVARQVLATDATLRGAHARPLIAIVGSSSVVNGVDAEVINTVWRAKGFEFEAINLGQTGLVAYELTLLRRFTLHRDVAAVVYLYNSFSFAEQLLGSVVGVRWDTAEMARLRPFDPRVPEHWRQYATGMVHEAFALVRYAPVARVMFVHALAGDLAPTPHFQDFAPEPGPDLPRTRTPESPAPADDWLRRAYVDSASAGDTLGYRGFVRFLELARARGVMVIVAPIPEPEFSRVNRWRIGTDPAAVDRRVASLATAHGVHTWPRTRQAALERDDTLFRDPTHFNRFGRDAYSRVLADWIADTVAR